MLRYAIFSGDVWSVQTHTIHIYNKWVDLVRPSREKKTTSHMEKSGFNIAFYHIFPFVISKKKTNNNKLDEIKQ